MICSYSVVSYVRSCVRVHVCMCVYVCVCLCMSVRVWGVEGCLYVFMVIWETLQKGKNILQEGSEQLVFISSQSSNQVAKFCQPSYMNYLLVV